MKNPMAVLFPSLWFALPFCPTHVPPHEEKHKVKSVLQKMCVETNTELVQFTQRLVVGEQQGSPL